MKTKLMIALTLCALSLSAAAQETYDLTIDNPSRYGSMPKNAFVANWHLTVPEGRVPEYMLFLIPTADGNDTLTTEFSHSEWRDFAKKNYLAVLTVGFDWKKEVPHHQNVEMWSGKMMLDALKQLSVSAGKPEIADLPLLLWGSHDLSCVMAQNLAAWNKVCVAAFVTDSGDSFAGAKGAEKVPALQVSSQKHLLSTSEVFNSARRRNAPWCLAPNKPGGREYTLLSMAFFEAIMAGAKSPWLGNLKDKSITPADGDKSASAKDTVWLPDEDFAHAWQLFVGGKE